MDAVCVTLTSVRTLLVLRERHGMTRLPVDTSPPDTLEGEDLLQWQLNECHASRARLSGCLSLNQLPRWQKLQCVSVSFGGHD